MWGCGGVFAGRYQRASMPTLAPCSSKPPPGAVGCRRGWRQVEVQLIGGYGQIFDRDHVVAGLGRPDVGQAIDAREIDLADKSRGAARGRRGWPQGEIGEVDYGLALLRSVAVDPRLAGQFPAEAVDGAPQPAPICRRSGDCLSEHRSCRLPRRPSRRSTGDVQPLAISI